MVVELLSILLPFQLENNTITTASRIRSDCEFLMSDSEFLKDEKIAIVFNTPNIFPHNFLKLSIYDRHKTT